MRTWVSMVILLVGLCIYWDLPNKPVKCSFVLCPASFPSSICKTYSIDLVRVELGTIGRCMRVNGSHGRNVKRIVTLTWSHLRAQKKVWNTRSERLRSQAGPCIRPKDYFRFENSWRFCKPAVIQPAPQVFSAQVPPVQVPPVLPSLLPGGRDLTYVVLQPPAPSQARIIAPLYVVEWPAAGDVNQGPATTFWYHQPEVIMFWSPIWHSNFCPARQILEILLPNSSSFYATSFKSSWHTNELYCHRLSWDKGLASWM